MSAPPFLSKRIRRISFPVRPAAPRLPIPAVAGAFKLAGYDGPLVVAPVASEDERGFLLEPDDLRALRDVRTL